MYVRYMAGILDIQDQQKTILTYLPFAILQQGALHELEGLALILGQHLCNMKKAANALKPFDQVSCRTNLGTAYACSEPSCGRDQGHFLAGYAVYVSCYDAP
jgi:hypothetical protein